MNEDYKQKFLCALEKQKKSFSPTTAEQHLQIMRMNGWTQMRRASSSELPSLNGPAEQPQTYEESGANKSTNSA